MKNEGKRAKNRGFLPVLGGHFEINRGNSRVILREFRGNCRELRDQRMAERRHWLAKTRDGAAPAANRLALGLPLPYPDGSGKPCYVQLNLRLPMVLYYDQQTLPRLKL